MEEAKNSKRKIEETNNADNDEGMSKKQKTAQQEIALHRREQKNQNGTIIFSLMTPEQARKILDGNPGIPFLIRESQKKGLITIEVLKNGMQYAIRFVLTEKGWKGCPKEEDELAVLMEKMISLDCMTAENHLKSFYQKLESCRLNPKFLVKPTETQQTQVQAYKGYKETFFESQEKKQSSIIIDEKASDEEMYDAKVCLK